MFLLMTNTDPDELGEALARVEDSRTSNGDAGGTHALATGVRPRGGGQGRGGGARGDRGGRGNARGRHDGKGHQPHHHQHQQWASRPLVQYQQQWASQPPAQQQQPQKHQRQPQQHQRQPQQQQRQPQQQQQQRPPGHLGGWVPSRVWFRCGHPGNFYAECRAVPPAPLNVCPPAPYVTPQHDPQANYSVTSPGDYASSSGEHGNLMPRRRVRKERRYLSTRPGASRPTGL